MAKNRRECMHDKISVAVQVVMMLTSMMPAQALPGNFSEDLQVTWGSSNVKILEGGQQLQLSLDRYSGSGFKSKKDYSFANVEMQIKLPPRDSTGTVVAFYLSSKIETQDELDFEFFGDVSGKPYIVQTNVIVDGVEGREQRIHLWFDPTTDFHTYQIFWTPLQTVFFVDRTPIRIFNKTNGQSYLDKRQMGIHSSIWNGGDWITNSDLNKTNWDNAPFVATYRNLDVKPAPIPPPLDFAKLSSVKKNYLVYDYCLDRGRYPIVPVECQ